MPKSKLFLIDAHALCYRSYFAIKGLSTSYGQATNAVYGFINTLKKILRDFQPEYMAVCFDVGKKTRREEKFAEYKIHRSTMPDDLISQIPLIKDVVRAYKLPVFELEGFEADDLIATIARKLSANNLEIVIVSGDKDMLQLVKENIKVFNTRKDEIMGYKQAREIFGIDPQKTADFIGLAGDKTDNIPGVMGIGEVTARELINAYGSIEKIFENLDKIKSQKIKDKLAGQKEQACFSKELATLDIDVPIEFDLKMLKVSSPDKERLFDLFKKFEFKKLVEEVSSDMHSDHIIETHSLSTMENIDGLIKKIREGGKFAFLIERDDQSNNVKVKQMIISLGENKVYGIKPEYIRHLKEIFEDLNIVKITQDIKEALQFLIPLGLFNKEKIFDVMLAGYLLSPSQSAYDIQTLGWMHLKISIPKDDLAKKADLIFRIYPVLEEGLIKKSLLKLFNEIEIPLSYVLFRMETDGICLDKKLLSKLSKDSQKKIDVLIRKIYKLAEGDFNLNSPKQLSHVLFEKLKLPVIKKTKTGFSTDEGVLVQLANKHPLPAMILEYRQLAKLKSTYIDALPKLINPETGCIHTTFNQTGTETGRLSSNNPNLQNIPIRTELGRQIRRAFISRKEDYIFISADYSQIELRILAHLSQDKNLMKAFQDNQDIHNFTASLIFDVKEKEVTLKMRNAAKRVNFGIIYGISAFGLAKDLGVSHPEAQDFIDRYFLRYPAVKQFMENEIKKTEETGFVLTLFNRRRYLPEIKSSNMGIRQFAQRQAINTPVQGSAADLIKLAMINVQHELEKKSLNSKMVLSVHDELVFDVPEEEKDVMTDLIREEMENPLTLSVPIQVTIKIGKNWLDMDEI